MALHVQLKPDLVDQLQVEAAKRGMSAEGLAQVLLQESLAHPSTRAGGDRPFHESATREEWEREFDQFVAGFDDVEAPDCNDEAFRRELIYDDRGLPK